MTTLARKHFPQCGQALGEAIVSARSSGIGVYKSDLAPAAPAAHMERTMPQRRVLICRVEDSTSGILTELAAFDLPTATSPGWSPQSPSTSWKPPR